MRSRYLFGFISLLVSREQPHTMGGICTRCENVFIFIPSETSDGVCVIRLSATSRPPSCEKKNPPTSISHYRRGFKLYCTDEFEYCALYVRPIERETREKNLKKNKRLYILYGYKKNTLS